MNGQQLESWTSVGGALDMKMYSMDDRDTPLDLAVTKTNDVQKTGMTGVIVDTLDKVSLDQSGLHHLAAVAELKQQEEEDMEVSPGPGLAFTEAVMMEGGGDTPRSATPTNCHTHLTTTTGHSSVPPMSPDSAIHSTIYSPSASPVTSRHGFPLSGFSSPYPASSLKTSPSLSRNNSDVSQYSLSPSQSPVTSTRYAHHPSSHPGYPSPAFPSSPLPRLSSSHPVILPRHDTAPALSSSSAHAPQDPEEVAALAAGQAGISRQQLINSPCPVCTDKISGFHYGIFSCESCKGFFKRTVQNKKNYVCLRGAKCPVTISTRKKCPACRFDKCLKMGMKLEAIREDRTRGGRSTYQCSYTIPPGLGQSGGQRSGPGSEVTEVPHLLMEIMKVEHLWVSSKSGHQAQADHESPTGYLASGQMSSSTITRMADQRLYKLVKWCKSLPLFKNIMIDDQISLLINAWCELLVLSSCHRSVSCQPGLIRVSSHVCLGLEDAARHGIEKCVEKMLSFTQQLRRLKVDQYEYVSMKLICLLTSDASGLKNPDAVRGCQEKVVHALQEYTVTHYPEMPSKFGELLLRMPELSRVCQVGKEMLCLNQQSDAESDQASPGFSLLMELLRDDQ